MKTPKAVEKRPYELGRRLEQMDASRGQILRAARAKLESQGYQELTMASLAVECGVTRQTIHNLFGTKRGVLEALFDLIALESGMEGMREAMMEPQPEAMLERFVDIFCGFWAKHRMLHRRVHGIGAIDPEFGAAIAARDRRRMMAATRIATRLGAAKPQAAALAALTSFEFFDALAESCGSDAEARATMLALTKCALTTRC